LFGPRQSSASCSTELRVFPLLQSWHFVLWPVTVPVPVHSCSLNAIPPNPHVLVPDLPVPSCLLSTRPGRPEIIATPLARPCLPRPKSLTCSFAAYLRNVALSLFCFLFTASPWAMFIRSCLPALQRVKQPSIVMAPLRCCENDEP
jgi:hypothetical protein